MAIIQVENLKKSFVTKKGPIFRRKRELVKAVDGISFSIEQGEIFSLLGPNRAGKTTTIKMLATLLIPDPEVILLDELTLGLDPVAAISLRKLIKRIAGQGKTILLTTHYMYEADEPSLEDVFIEMTGSTISDKEGANGSQILV